MLVRSRCLDQVRSARVRRVTLVDAVPDDQLVVTDKRVGERGQLYGALDRLGADQRHVLELGYFSGLVVAGDRRHTWSTNWYGQVAGGGCAFELARADRTRRGNEKRP